LKDNFVALHFKYDFWHITATAGSDVVQSGSPIFDDFLHCVLSTHLFFTSPEPANLLSKQERTNKWLAEQFHGLPWIYGEVPYEEMKNILDAATTCFDFLLVKGAEKCKTLNYILPFVKIYNIESLDCPPFRQLRSSTDEKCLYHYLKGGNFICSKSQVISMANWYRLQSVDLKKLF
jgi:hypothetical protein